MCKRVQKLCKGKMVSTDARELLCGVAGPRSWSDTRDSWLARAARRLGFSFARTRNIFYGRARIIRAEEWMRLNEEFTALNESAARRLGALHDLDSMARSISEARREVSRPMGVENRAPSQARFGAKRSP